MVTQLCYSSGENYFDFASMGDMNFNKNLGNFIRTVREAQGLTQAEVAALMNVNAQNISSYERGERGPSVEWVIRLCDALKVEPENFFFEFLTKKQHSGITNEN
jgi:transcriptional regulator with XRE-family HTH domain